VGARSLSGTIEAICWGGAACAVLDGTAATVQFALKGIKPQRLWQAVGSGALGEAAFRQGWSSAALGLLAHWFIAFTAAAVFVATSQWFPFLLQDFVIAGVVYGIVVFLFMSQIVVPMSRRPPAPRSTAVIVTQLIIHILFVGLPISTAASHFLSSR
jgi:uncharacterized membrane protein YagU involved in acid resistance